MLIHCRAGIMMCLVQVYYYTIARYTKAWVLILVSNDFDFDLDINISTVQFDHDFASK